MSDRFKTPFVECLYPFLQQPNQSKNDKIPDSFQITLVLDKKIKEHTDLLKKISDLHKEAGGKEKVGDKGHPIKFATNPEGALIKDKFHVRFKSKAEFCDHVPTFDSQGETILREKNFVSNGSIVCVNWSYGFYDNTGNMGVTLFLNGVQIRELIEWHGYSAEDMGFGKEEGYQEFGGEVDKAATKVDEALKAESKKDEGYGEQDDLPF